MRIAIFSNTYLPTVSGVVRSIVSYKKALEQLGHEVHIFTQGTRSYNDEEPNIHRYFSFQIGLPNNLPVTVPYSRRFDRLLRELKPDVVHSQHPVLLGSLAQQKAHQLGIPLVYTLHAQYWEYSVYLPFRVLQVVYARSVVKQLKRYMENCDHIVAPSESLHQYISSRFEIAQPISVIPTGINLELFDHNRRAEFRARQGWANQFVIVSTGRLAPEKNWPDLIKAIAPIMQRHPQIQLALIGDGPQRSELEKLTVDLGIAKRVMFMGMVNYEKVPEYLIASDLFAFASLTETQGLVTLEAMAAGLPVVAYDGIGTRDVVDDGINGILTQANPLDLAAAIETIIEDTKLRAQLQVGAQSTARKMDIHVLAERLVRVYETSIAQVQKN
jgi:glycosyltransferase involved in cell wall biosynthesis